MSAAPALRLVGEEGSGQLRQNAGDALEVITSAIEQIEERRPDKVTKLVCFVSASASRARRLNRRDALLRALAADRYPEPSGRATKMIAALEVFRTGTYRHSGRGDTDEQAVMRKILDSNKGRVPGKRQVQLILAGNRTPPAK